MKTKDATQRVVSASYLVSACGLAPSLATAQTMCSSGVCVLTWQNDTYRTGDNLNETTLTYGNLGKDTFGQRCSFQVDGQVYAQPLVVTNVTIAGTQYVSVVYIVTQNDSVYAFNGTPPSSGNTCQKLIGPVSLLNNNFTANRRCLRLIAPTLGKGTATRLNRLLARLEHL